MQILRNDLEEDDKVLIELSRKDIDLIEMGLILECGRYNRKHLDKGIIYADIDNEIDIYRNKLHSIFYKLATGRDIE